MTKMEQIKKLSKDEDKSLQFLVNEAYRIFQNPMIIYNADWDILVYTEDAVTDDPIWNAHIQIGSLTNEIVRNFAELGFADIVASPKVVVLLSNEKMKYDRLMGKMFNAESVIVAGVSMVASNRPFENQDSDALEIFCKMLTKKFCRDIYFTNYGQKKIEEVMNNLLGGNIKDKLYDAAFVEILYKGLKNILHIAVADVQKSDVTYTELIGYRDLFRQIRSSSFRYTIYENHIVFIISADTTGIDHKRSLSSFKKIIEQENIHLGVSRSFENLFELPIYYAEALEALKNKNGKKDQRVFWFDGKNG